MSDMEAEQELGDDAVLVPDDSGSDALEAATPEAKRLRESKSELTPVKQGLDDLDSALDLKMLMLANFKISQGQIAHAPSSLNSLGHIVMF